MRAPVSTEPRPGDMGNSDFDFFVMGHCFEHLVSPRAILRGIAQSLSPSGLFLVSVPNTESRVARITGRRWSWFVPPVLLHYFGKDALMAAVQGLPLELVWIREQQGDAYITPVELLLAALRYLKGGRIGPDVGTGSLGLRASWTGAAGAADAMFRKAENLPFYSSSLVHHEDSELAGLFGREAESVQSSASASVRDRIPRFGRRVRSSLKGRGCGMLWNHTRPDAAIGSLCRPATNRSSCPAALRWV
jgi:SAM-dependent methyltransferase